MATRRVLEDSTSISSNETVTSSELDLSNDEATTFQFEGDENSNDLTFIIEAGVDPIDNWGTLDILENLNLTEGTNNTKIRQYDTLDLERLRVKTTNNGASSTTLSIVASKSEQQ